MTVCKLRRTHSANRSERIGQPDIRPSATLLNLGLTPLKRGVRSDAGTVNEPVRAAQRARLDSADGRCPRVRRSRNPPFGRRGEHRGVLPAHPRRRRPDSSYRGAHAGAGDEAIRRKTQHVIHDEDGKTGERNAYGRAPRPQAALVAALSQQRFQRWPTERVRRPWPPVWSGAAAHWVTALTYHVGPYSLPVAFSRTTPKRVQRFLPLCTIPDIGRQASGGRTRLAAVLGAGETWEAPTIAQILRRRSSTGTSCSVPHPEVSRCRPASRLTPRWSRSCATCRSRRALQQRDRRVPEDVVGAVVYFASPASAFVTGRRS